MFGVWPKEATWAMMLLQSIMSSSSNSERQNPHKKKIKIRKIKKEGRKREKRWVKKGGVELYWQVHVMWNVVVDWQSVTYDTSYREREDDIHKSYHTHSRTPAFLDFGDLPTCHCYDAQCQGAKICWTLGEEKQR